MATVMHGNDVAQAVQHIIERECEEHIKKAVKDYEAALREKVAHIVCGIHNFYTVERMGGELLIRVQIGEKK